jgi:tRNA threonylcarbamoyladenosine biosynthesis protein TsaB
VLILGLETSAATGQVCLLESQASPGASLILRTLTQAGRRHAQSLVAEISAMFSDHGKAPTNLGGIAVSIGPGSFTGLRVGITCAKTLAYALSIPVVGIPTFEVLAAAIHPSIKRFAIVDDAQRGEFFVQSFERTASGLSQTSILNRLGPKLVAAACENLPIYGPGAAKLAALTQPNPPTNPAQSFEGQHPITPHASLVCQLAVPKFLSESPTNPDTLEPIYLGPSAAEVQWNARLPQGAN